MFGWLKSLFQGKGSKSRDPIWEKEFQVLARWAASQPGLYSMNEKQLRDICEIQITQGFDKWALVRVLKKPDIYKKVVAHYTVGGPPTERKEEYLHKFLIMQVESGSGG